MLLRAWHALGGYPHAPECCLINFYGALARMGLHQDRDESEFAAPVVSLSLGDTCLFRVGGTRRNDATRSVRLASGDCDALSGRFLRVNDDLDDLVRRASEIADQQLLTLRINA